MLKGGGIDNAARESAKREIKNKIINVKAAI